LTARQALDKKNGSAQAVYRYLMRFGAGI